MRVSRQFYRNANPFLYRSIWAGEHRSALEGISVGYPGSKKRKNIDGVGITDVNSKLALLSNTREIVDWHAGASRVWMSHVVEPILPNIKVLSTTFVPNSVPVVAKEIERHLPALRTA
jgi:hypothetical protein